MNLENISFKKYWKDNPKIQSIISFENGKEIWNAAIDRVITNIIINENLNKNNN